MSSVGVRGIVLLLLAVVVGGAAGWAYAERSSEPVVSTASPSPVAAADPAIPDIPQGTYRRDADLPVVPSRLATDPARIGTPRGDGILVPAPVGWERTFLPGLESKWSAPGGVEGSYGVRVKRIVGENRTRPQKVAELVAALPFDPLVSELEVLDTSADTFRAYFTFDGYRRFNIVRYVSFDGNLVDVEISATGRVQDQAGLEALVATMATGVREQELPQKPGADTSSRTR